ncbi:MAG: hypothetical protein ABJB66_07530 [Gemmatimonadaceae bacterium]
MSNESQSFGTMLTEAKTELNDAETRELAFAHVERLSLAAHQTLLAMLGTHLPRPGGHVYVDGGAPQLRNGSTALDVRF